MQFMYLLVHLHANLFSMYLKQNKNSVLKHYCFISPLYSLSEMQYTNPIKYWLLIYF